MIRDFVCAHFQFVPNLPCLHRPFLMFSEHASHQKKVFLLKVNLLIETACFLFLYLTDSAATIGLNQVQN